MSSKDYWNKRETEALKHYITDEKEYDKRIKEIYEDMLDSIQKEIDGFFGRYAKAEGISIAEAKKRVSALDIAAYERKAKRYVKDREFSKTANEEMRLYNLTMKVNRLELLKANIGLELVKGFNGVENLMEEILKGRTIEELKRQAGILGKTIQNNSKLADAIVNASFHNATFSDRVWMYQDMMKAELSKLLQSGLIQGKNPRVLAKDIRKTFNASRYNAERLMRTELARVQTEAQKQSFERNDFELYTFIANADCCPICAKLDGKHFAVKNMMPGTNAAPMHPHCRCSQAPYEDNKEYEAWLDYLDKGGTTEDWNNGAKAVWKNKKRHDKNVKKSESEESKKKYKYKDTVVNEKDINSAAYRKRIDNITDNTEVNRSIWNVSKDMLSHRSGTKFEDLAYIDSNTGKYIINKSFNKESCANPSKKMNQMLKDASDYTVIGVHNHPGSSVPSMGDIFACLHRKYKCGVVVCHDGKIYQYSVNGKRFNKIICNYALERMEKEGYTNSVKNMFNDSGIEMKVL